MSDFERLWPGGPVFRQAAHFRLGTDAVLLADFIRPDGRRRGIDLGCASGALMLLLLGERRPWVCLAVPLLTTGLVFLLFGMGLHVDLP